MTTPNPFRLRDSERERDHTAFVRSFGPTSMDVLPPLPWDKPFILRSAPGAGKTSLMRMLRPASLHAAAALHDHGEPIKARLRDRGFLADNRPTVLGVYVNLDNDFRSLLDLGVRSETAERVFFRLLDARVMLEAVRAALTLVGGSFPLDAPRVRVVPGGDEAARALELLGGPAGDDLLRTATQAETELLDLLDVLTPAEGAEPAGHHRLHALTALSGADLSVDGTSTGARPLVMFDDGHALDPSQRTALLDQLRSRGLRLDRWFAERTEALTDAALLDAGVPERDYETRNLEDEFVRNKKRFHNMLLEIANRRASVPLGRVTDVSDQFQDLLEVPGDALLAGRDDEVLGAARGRVVEAAGSDARYEEWLDTLRGLQGREGLARIAETGVLVARDRGRAQGELFAEVLPADALGDRGNAGLREGALLREAHAQKLPYYSGVNLLTGLASTNVEQFLTLSGDLFAEVLLTASVGRDPHLAAERQDRVLRRASRVYWDQIASGVPHGPLVQTFVKGIAGLATREAAKPTLPYPPGVTGTALAHADRDALIDPDRRARVAGADLLLTALTNAVAYNVLSVDKNYRVKGGVYLVIYLNRLLCPYFGLPLGYGGFRERRLQEMASWMLPKAHVPRHDRLL